jgi:hypothetical protein
VPLTSQTIIIPGVLKGEVLIITAGSSNNKCNIRNSYGDIFAEQLGVTLSLSTNSTSYWN